MSNVSVDTTLVIRSEISSEAKSVDFYPIAPTRTSTKNGVATWCFDIGEFCLEDFESQAVAALRNFEGELGRRSVKDVSVELWLTISSGGSYAGFGLSSAFMRYLSDMWIDVIVSVYCAEAEAR